MINPRIGIIQFPGVNCEYETARPLESVGMNASILRWNMAPAMIPDFDGFVLPGGFSYQDRVRAGAVAASDDIMETLMAAAEDLPNLVEVSFGGAEANSVLQRIGGLGEEEWKADKMERKFARHFYDIEDKLDPITVVFLDKYCKRLAEVANNAEKTAKFLRLIVHKK